MSQERAVQTNQQTTTTSSLASSVLQRKCACGQHTHAGGECAGCRKKSHHLQRRAVNEAGPAAAPPIVNEVLRSPGQPLDSDTRAFMEPRFDHDFSRVQAHTGSPEMIQRQPIGGEEERVEEPDEEARRELEEEEGAGPIFTTVTQLKRLVIGSSSDAYEREADRVADGVMQRDTQDPLAELYRSEIDAPLATAPLPIQRVSNNPQPRTVDLDLDQSGGQPLERRVQRDMESRFGYSFENARIHNYTKSHRIARSLNARAFTVGNNIYFGRGEYNPTSGDGKHLLAHELTHVVQQGKAKPFDSTVNRKFIPMDMIHRKVRRGEINVAQLAKLPQTRISVPTERTRTTHHFQSNPARGGDIQRQTLQVGDTVIQLVSGGGGGGGGGGVIRAEASFDKRGTPDYRAHAFLEGTLDGSACKFVDGSITADKTTVGGFLVTMGVTTERGPTKYQESDKRCEINAGKRDCFRYYLHFAAVMGIGVSVSQVGVSGTWIMAQHDHIADLRICANGRGRVKQSSQRTKGPGGDVIDRNISIDNPWERVENPDVVTF